MGTHTSLVRFAANGPGDGKIEVTITPFDIELHKSGNSGYPQAWNNDAHAHFSDGDTVYTVTYSVGPDDRFNSYADALAGNTSVTELTRSLTSDRSNCAIVGASANCPT